jgi:hypothetical protein
MARQFKPLLSLSETFERLGMNEVEVEQPTSMTEDSKELKKQNRVTLDDVLKSVKSLARIRD